MKSKLFLTSLTAIAFAIPATADTFPGDGYMKENKTYTNAATSTNMDGVYENSVNAIAEYDNIDYNLTAGKYLPQSSVTITDCPSGSYCTGIGDVNYSESSAQGITPCPDGYGTSAVGSSANTQCYRACHVDNMGSGKSIASIAHATVLSGNDYYGAGVDTCEPTACENGWHVKPGAPDLTTSIGVTQAGTNYAAIDNSGNDMNSNASTYGLSSSDHNAFVVDYGGGKKISGHGRCSTQSGTNNYFTWSDPTIVNSLTDETGQSGAQYCYCQLDGYTLTNSTLQSLSAPWVFLYDYGGAGSCAGNCAILCALDLRDDDTDTLAFRAAVFGSLGSSLASCEANQITINWHDVDPTYAGQNNEGTATYGGDIRTPFKALDKTNEGKSFKGWRFEKPTTPSNP